METILTHMEAIAPTFLAIMSLIMFTKQTRWLCYATVVLAIIAELIPMTLNLTALLACITCLAALLASEFLRKFNITHPFFSR